MRLSIQEVADEVAYYYGVPKSVALEIVRRIRDRAYKAKSRRGRERRQASLPARSRSHEHFDAGDL